MKNPENDSGEVLFSSGYRTGAALVTTWTTIIAVAMGASFLLFPESGFSVFFSKILFIALIAGTIGCTLWRYLDWKYNL